jgi:hypothetical protein
LQVASEKKRQQSWAMFMVVIPLEATPKMKKKNDNNECAFIVISLVKTTTKIKKTNVDDECPLIVVVPVVEVAFNMKKRRQQ